VMLLEPWAHAYATGWTDHYECGPLISGCACVSTGSGECSDTLRAGERGCETRGVSLIPTSRSAFRSSACSVPPRAPGRPGSSSVQVALAMSDSVFEDAPTARPVGEMPGGCAFPHPVPLVGKQVA
jgi:hypothetical protein